MANCYFFDGLKVYNIAINKPEVKSEDVCCDATLSPALVMLEMLKDQRKKEIVNY